MAVKKSVKIKPVGASEIKDIKIIREAIEQVRKERSPEEWEHIKENSRKRQEFLKRMMGA